MEQNETKSDLSFVYFLLVCLLTIIVLGESIVIFRLNGSKITTNTTKTTSVDKGTSLISPTKNQNGSMSILLDANQTVTLGKTLNAKIIFTSSITPVGGVDAVLVFDPALVKIQKITQNKDIFGQFLVNANNETVGRIKITAYVPTKQLIGPQTLATLKIQLLKNTPAEVKLEFVTPGETKDSNLVSQVDNKDILGTVIPLRLVPDISR